MLGVLQVISITIFFYNSINALKPDTRIIGGTKVQDRSQFAYQALILYKNSPYCGGTIIDEKHILTAAHCCFDSNGELLNPSDLSVIVGNLKLTDYSEKNDVKIIVTHENYNPSEIINDIALFTVSENYTFSDKIQPASLANFSVTSGSCRVSGWGVTNTFWNVLSDDLMYVDVPVVENTVCKSRYPNLGDKQICAGESGKDSCQGDSGGPLMCSGYLAGIVSYGWGCAQVNYPGVYTAISSYLDWIEEAKLRSTASSLYAPSLLSLTLFITIIFLK